MKKLILMIALVFAFVVSEALPQTACVDTNPQYYPNQTMTYTHTCTTVNVVYGVPYLISIKVERVACQVGYGCISEEIHP